MLRSKTGWLALLGCIAGIFAVQNSALAETAEAPSSMQTVENFGSGYLVVYIERARGIEAFSDVQVLRDAKLIKLGERYFIRGKGTLSPADANDPRYKWFEGTDIAYDWSNVVQFSALASEQYQLYQNSLRIED